MDQDEQRYWDQPCYYCEKPAGRGVLQQTDTYALVCPRCKRLNSIRLNVVSTLPVLTILLVIGEVKACSSSIVYAQVFSLLPSGILWAEIPVFVLLSMIGATVLGAIKVADIIRGKQPRMPDWHESEYQDTNVVSSTITPPFRDEPARISLCILEGTIPRFKEKD
jgi:hypothetical protein